MKTPEEIAREAAERLVTAGEYQQYGRLWDWVFVNGQPVFESIPHQSTEDAVAMLRSLCAPVILAAIETALYQCPVPSPVSEERLEEVRVYVRRIRDQHPTTVVDDLFQHIDHLHRILCGPEAEAMQAMYDLGYRRGREDASHDRP